MPAPVQTGKGIVFQVRATRDGQPDDSLVKAVKTAVASGLPGAEIGAGGKQADYCITVSLMSGPLLSVTVTLSGPQTEKFSTTDREIGDPRYGPEDRRRRPGDLVKLAVLKLLSKAFKAQMPPWGILVGVRPTKLVHRMVDQGFTWPEIENKLQSVYGMSENKARLLLGVARRQRRFLPTANPGEDLEAARRVGIYIGIPFCPTRCTYCSFAAYPLSSHGHLVDGFLAALKEEMEAVGEFVAAANLTVESIYFGGGTPTVFDAATTGALAERAGQLFAQPGTVEYTFEAGRPDTINGDKLQALRAAGVNRISVNPQTLCANTLRLIGRDHSVASFYSAFEAARLVEFPVINVDLIVGLPGEDVATVSTTLRQIEKLEPENLTVHSLAVKRASALQKVLDNVELPDSQAAARMVDLGAETAARLNMKPFYLYRQRNIVGDLENVGYALEGAESVFNIQMMEERQTIIGLGAGAVTKLVSPGSWSLERVTNPKCPATYARNQRELTGKKLGRLREHFNLREA